MREQIVKRTHRVPQPPRPAVGAALFVIGAVLDGFGATVLIHESGHVAGSVFSGNGLPEVRAINELAGYGWLYVYGGYLFEVTVLASLALSLRRRMVAWLLWGMVNATAVEAVWSPDFVEAAGKLWDSEEIATIIRIVWAASALTLAVPGWVLMIRGFGMGLRISNGGDNGNAGHSR